MNLDSLIRIVNQKLRETQSRPLNSAEVLIIRGIWHYKTYSKIAEEGSYSTGYLTNVVAPELFQRLFALIGQRINKKNCRLLLESYATSQTVSVINIQKELIEFPSDTNQESSPRYPSGSVPLNSSFYLKRSLVDDQVYAEIKKPGALVRIKAPREMGKTSLILRTLDYAERHGYYTVSLNLEQTDQAILSNLNRFLRWLCANVASQLDFDAKLDDYWDEDIGSKVSCSLYFRNCLLEQIDSPLVLVLDEAHHIFEYPQVAKDFLPLLRSWYEEAKRLPVWQKLRLIIVHSTEIYVPLQLQQSPFNVGLPVQLTCFSLEQVQQLAQRYGLDWTDGKEAQQLMDMVGGHPALVNIALYHLNRGEITLLQLLETAPTSTGIYVHHLQRHWATLQKQPELAIALGAVISTTEPVLLEPIIAYKLSSMGLIKLANNKATLSCQLYRHYFQRDFFPENRQI
ncbi:AAA-like domain-containing protein [Halotia branconii]|uniref:AAA-like domain-containing protein n=1 Tax=Halotia branconii CENA392 TaxID=1539056 RepID=A0AAJ6NNB9_9CYAN|nr:AAA-like domain-containing protein [Halotia branconii]WGV23571.1 AAA-like domain-containing protein [Halotia branconii CENA392]